MPKTSTSLSDDKVLALFRFRLDGRTVAWLAKWSGTSPGYICDILRGRRRWSFEPDNPDRVLCVKAELARLAMRARRRAKRAMSKAIQDYLKGDSLSTAADEWGLPKTSVWREMVKRGTRRRSPNRKASKEAKP